MTNITNKLLKCYYVFVSRADVFITLLRGKLLFRLFIQSVARRFLSRATYYSKALAKSLFQTNACKEAGFRDVPPPPSGRGDTFGKSFRNSSAGIVARISSFHAATSATVLNYYHAWPL